MALPQRIRDGLRSLGFLFRFAAILALAVGFVVFREDLAAVWFRWVRPSGPTTVDVGTEDVYWFCPMHLQVVREEPGACPICGMPLSKRARVAGTTALPEGVAARLTLSPFRIRQAGIRTEVLRHRYLVKEVETVGTIEPDERRVIHVSARTAGRIDKLFVDFTGVEVDANQPLLLLYSPELVSAQAELLQALDALDAARTQGGAIRVAEAERVVGAAEERLLLWGVHPRQVEAVKVSRATRTHLTVYSPARGVVMEKHAVHGHYVEEGTMLYGLVDLSVVWMVAEVHERESAWIRIGQEVEVQASAHPDRRYTGRVSFIEPVLHEETRSVRVRMDMDNESFGLKPGMYVTARIRVPIGQIGTPAAYPTLTTVYTCASHGEVLSDEPGTCPHCGAVGLSPTVTMVSPEPPDALGQRTLYICPMHREVRQETPGRCKACGGMELVPVKEPSLGGVTETRCICLSHPDQVGDEGASCAWCGEALQPRPVKLVLAVPVSAVIDTGMRRVVYVESAPGVFDAREVTLGPEAGGYLPVVAGVAYGEKVAVAGAFLLDAETQLSPSAGAKYFGAGDRPRDRPRLVPTGGGH